MKPILKKPIIILLIIFVILIVIFLIFQQSTPNRNTNTLVTKPQINSITSTNLTQVPIEISTELPVLEETLPVHYTTPKIISAEELIKTFNLTNTPYPDRYTGDNGNRTLTLDTYINRFVYSDNNYGGHFDPALAYFVEPEKAVVIANEFVSNMLQIDGATPLLQEAWYYIKNATHEVPTQTNTNSNVIEIPYTLIPQDDPVFIDTQPHYPLYVYVDSADKVIGFRIYQDLFTITSTQQVSTIDPKLIPTLLKTGQTSIIKRSAQSTNQLDLNRINSVNIDKIDLEYRYSPTSNMVAPHLRVTATLTQTGYPAPSTVEFLVLAVQAQP